MSQFMKSWGDLILLIILSENQDKQPSNVLSGITYESKLKDNNLAKIIESTITKNY